MIRKDNDFLIVGEKEKEGVWDIKKQTLIIPYQDYKLGFEGQYLDSAYFWAKNKSNLYGILDAHNQLVIPFEYTSVATISGKNTYYLYQKSFVFMPESRSIHARKRVEEKEKCFFSGFQK